MNKRTIKPAAGDSRVSAAAAKSAARYVRRDSVTGKYVIWKDDGLIRSEDRVRIYGVKVGPRKSRGQRETSLKVAKKR